MESDIERIAARLTEAQKRMLAAIPVGRPKKWRAIFRHAKVRGWNGMLPFSLARPTLTGSEYLTPLGQQVRAHIERQAHD